MVFIKALIFLTTLTLIGIYGLECFILEPNVAGRAGICSPGNLNRILSDIGRVDDKPLDDDVFLAGSGKIKDAIGAGVRPQSD